MMQDAVLNQGARVFKDVTLLQVVSVVGCSSVAGRFTVGSFTALCFTTSLVLQYWMV